MEKKLDKKLKKIYLPGWVLWFALIILIPLALLISYESFFGKEPNILSGIMNLFIILAFVILIFLLSYRKLPYLLIET